MEQKGLVLQAYVIMTNHVHCILRCTSGSLSDVVRDLKRHTSKEILNEIRESQTESRKEWLLMIFKYHARFNKRNGSYQLWTQENHAVELTSNSMIESRIDYIHNNPVRSGWVDNPEDYVYSSARNYLGETGVLEVEMI